MFDLRKTIVLIVVIVAIVLDFIAGFEVGKLVGYTNCKDDMLNDELELVIRQDSMMAKQTEFCHRIMDSWYENKQ